VGIREAEMAMTSLEMTQCRFDYSKIDFYRSKARDFLERKHSMFPGQTVLLDVTAGRVELPTALSERIDKWMLEHPDFSLFMRTFARNYLISLLGEYSHQTPYRPLAECVVEGADFYLETGMMYFRDAGAVKTWA
jgi:hypothetical protein